MSGKDKRVYTFITLGVKTGVKIDSLTHRIFRNVLCHMLCVNYSGQFDMCITKLPLVSGLSQT